MFEESGWYGDGDGIGDAGGEIGGVGGEDKSMRIGEDLW